MMIRVGRDDADCKWQCAFGHDDDDDDDDDREAVYNRFCLYVYIDVTCVCCFSPRLVSLLNKSPNCTRADAL